MSFQPIVDLSTGAVFAFEALVRGTEGQGAQTVLSTLTEANRYAFDQACRVKAIQLGARLGAPATGALLSINFLPNAVYEPKACIQLTLATAKATGFPTDKLLFEFTEDERLDHDHVGRILTTYKAMGFKTAIDDFGAGFAGLTLLAKWQPDIIKLDMELVRGHRPRPGAPGAGARDRGRLHRAGDRGPGRRRGDGRRGRNAARARGDPAAGLPVRAPRLRGPARPDGLHERPDRRRRLATGAREARPGGRTGDRLSCARRPARQRLPGRGTARRSPQQGPASRYSLRIVSATASIGWA